MQNNNQRFSRTPFDPKVDIEKSGDLLERKPIAETLNALLDAIEAPFVLAVDGKWGSGKTTFALYWIASLKTQSAAVVYLNAWEQDFSADPFVALLATLKHEMKEEVVSESDRKKLTKFLQSGKKLAGLLAKNAIPIAVKAATAGTIDLADIDVEGLDSAMEKIAEKRVDEYIAERNTVKSFVSALEEFVASQVAQDTSKRPVVIIVDELDRCRPDYAVLLLERLKHFFSVKGLIFVLVADLDQLGHAVKGLYGESYDGRDYLRRFIDFQFQLPDRNLARFVSATAIKFGINGFTNNTTGFKYFTSTLTICARAYSLTLRSVEQLLVRVRVVLALDKSTKCLEQNIVLALVVTLQAYDRSALGGLLRGEFPTENLIEKAVKNCETLNIVEPNFIPILRAYLICYFASDVKYQAVTDSVNGLEPSTMTDFQRHFSSMRSNRDEHRNLFLQEAAEVSKHLDLLGQLQ